MTTAEQEEPPSGFGWERLGQAAEHFARRVARDARKFAERIEEHAGEFADEVAREWSWSGRDRRREQERPSPDIRRIVEEVRSILADVIDGVDELIGRLFTEARKDAWARVVANRDASCVGCGGVIAAGGEAYVRRTPTGTEFRCLVCGVPGTSRA